jgi:hypothetical protein
MPTNPNRRLQLAYYTQAVFTQGITQGYRLIVTASNGNLMPNEIFRYFQNNAVPGYPQGLPQFKGVCTPAELNALPIGAPDPTNPTNFFFRSATADLTYQTPSDANDGWNSIIIAVSQLKTALDCADATNAPTIFWIGQPPAGG